jgi:hypothetical protein
MDKKTIAVRVGRFAAPVKNVRVNEGATIKELMEQISASEELYTFVAINGKRSTLDTVLKNDDLLYLGFPIRGEATVRRNGKSWRIHANDPDGIVPSDFHAHNIETGEILDLYTSIIYDGRTGSPLAGLHKKDWLALLRAFKSSKETTISSKCEIVLRRLGELASNEATA